MVGAQDLFADLDAWFRAYGYWFTFLGMALETVLFTSAIVPGLFITLFAGYYAGLGRGPLLPLLATCVAGLWVGDLTSYLIGRFFWSRLLARTRAGRWVETVKPALQTRSRLFFLLYHFEPISRMVGATAAGVAKVPVRHWLPASFLGGLLWISFYGLLGFALGSLGRDLTDWSGARPVQAVATIVLLVWAVLSVRAVRRALSAGRGAARQVEPSDGTADPGGAEHD